MQRNFAAQTGFIIFGLGHCDQRARLFHPVAPRGFFEKGPWSAFWFHRDATSRRRAKSLSSSAFIRGIPVETDRGRTQFQSDLPVAACGDDLKKINRESAPRLVQRLKVA